MTFRGKHTKQRKAQNAFYNTEYCIIMQNFKHIYSERKTLCLLYGTRSTCAEYLSQLDPIRERSDLIYIGQT